VKPSLIRTYADLARPELKGKLCLRDRANVYNQSLVADQLIQRGQAATRTWLKGLVANVKQPYFSSDTPIARAVGRGEPVDEDGGIPDNPSRNLLGDGRRAERGHVRTGRWPSRRGIRPRRP